MMQLARKSFSSGRMWQCTKPRWAVAIRFDSSIQIPDETLKTAGSKLAKNHQMSELNDEHYLRAVTSLGDTRKIVAQRDIYSQSGMKLVASGIHLTSDLYERLVRHKMLLPLDMALAVENMLDQKAILQDVIEL